MIVPDVEELTAGEPAELVVENARRKAQAGAELAGSGRVVLGVDTDVALDGDLLGKPADEEGARRRLRVLSGRTHEVLSGVALVGGGRESTELVATGVTFRRLEADEINRYVASGEWMGRAGGYAVQGLGSSLIAAIDGDLSNVIGLPIPALSGMIASLQKD